MPRPRRAAEGGLVYHVLNRANARQTIFESDEDYAAFERVLAQAVVRWDMRLLAYCLMPNHFHLLVWPRDDGDLSQFMRWLTVTHTQRWHPHHGTAGSGHVYQGRFKSFPVESDAWKGVNAWKGVGNRKLNRVPAPLTVPPDDSRAAGVVLVRVVFALSPTEPWW